jgi:hypothetical protein
MPEENLITYGLLSQTHPTYDAKLWATLNLFYRGGFEVLKQAKSFLHKAPNESEERYSYRLKHASYICYFGQIVDYLVGALSHEKLQVAAASEDGQSGSFPDPTFYAEFAENADLARLPFDALMAQAMTTALICKRAWIAVDLPTQSMLDEPATSRAEEEAWGVARAYAFERHPEEVLNWNTDESGRLSWLVTRRRVCERSSPFQRQDTWVEHFKVWFMSSGTAQWTLFETTEKHEGDETPSDNEPLVEIGSGTTSFNRIPFVAVELPWGLWAGNKIGPLAIEHFQRRSDLRGSVTSSLVETPYVKLGPEISGVGDALPSEAQQDPSRGAAAFDAMRQQGFIRLGADDDIGYVSPQGRGYEIADKGLDSTRDEMYRTVTAMALSLNNTGAAVARSGESKREDRSATEIVLSALSAIARRKAVEVYDLVADGRNETANFEAQGLSVFNVGEIEELLDEAERVDALQIPSPTFRKTHLSRVALRLLPNSSPETKATIKQELEDAVDEGDDLQKLMQQRLVGDDGTDPTQRGDKKPDPGATPGRGTTPPQG